MGEEEGGGREREASWLQCIHMHAARASLPDTISHDGLSNCEPNQFLLPLSFFAKLFYHSNEKTQQLYSTNITKECQSSPNQRMLCKDLTCTQEQEIESPPTEEE